MMNSTYKGDVAEQKMKMRLFYFDIEFDKQTDKLGDGVIFGVGNENI